MKFLADENFPKPLAVKIRNFGYSVKTIQQKNLQGSPDEKVAKLALREKRIILTFDKDFLKNQPRNLPKIIFHFPKIPTNEIAPLMEKLLGDLKEIKPSQSKTLKFSKNGLEILEDKE